MADDVPYDEIRPQGHPEDLPWPPKMREYPEDHPARSREESKEAFNEDWAREDFGEEFVGDLMRNRRGFCGDWWLLAYLVRDSEGRNASGVHAEAAQTFRHWNSLRHEFKSTEFTIHLEHMTHPCGGLGGVDLSYARLDNAILMECHMERAILVGAQLGGASLRLAHLEHSKLWNAKMSRCNVAFARFANADMSGVRAEAATLDRADFSDADVRGATGLRFDQNPVRGLRIEGNAPDPWSQLRRKYTGPWFFVHAALLVLFVLPYVGRVLVLTAAGEAARHVDSLATAEQVPAWKLLIGLDRGWLFPAFAPLLVVFNAIRAVLTIKVGMLRDAEERSGVTPALKEYMPLFNWHRVARWLSFIALIVVVYNTCYWVANTSVPVFH